MMEDDPFAFMRGEVVPEGNARTDNAVASGIIVVLENDEHGKPTKESEEAVGKALELNSALGSRVEGWVVSENATERAKSFVHYGMDKIFVCSTNKSDTRSRATILSGWAKKNRSELWIFLDSRASRRLAARFAAQLSTGLVTSVEEMNIDFNDRSIEMTHLELQGKLKRTLVTRAARPQVATLALGCGSPARLDEAVRSPIEIVEG